MGASLLFLLSAVVFSAGNAHPTTFQCSRYCKENWSKFGYEIGSSYLYNYNGVVKTMVNATSDGVNTESRLLFTTQVQISVLSTCDYVMHLSNINFEEIYINKDAVIRHNPDKTNKLETSFNRHALYFSFQNGRIETVCPEEEDQDILNIKKAILSAFQNSMPNLEEDSIVYETDISGNCETRYQIEDSTSNLVIKKTKNLEACSHRKSRYLSWLSVPYFKSSKNSASLLRSKQMCKQRFNEDLILKSTHCSEEHLFQPFSNGDNGAVTYLSQTLEFVSKDKTIRNLEVPKNIRYETLLSNYMIREEFKGKEITSVTKLLENLERRTTDGVEPDVPRLFSQLVHELQTLDHDTMIAVFQSVKHSLKQKKFLLDAMPLITTVDGINTMKMLYDEGEVSESQMNSWIGSLVFLTNISLPTINAITPLMEANKSIRQKAILSGSTLVYMYCKEDVRCLDKPEIQKVIKIIQDPIVSSCTPTSPNHYNEILLALKGIGNIGLASSLDYLRNCYSNTDSPMELRLAAIAAHRRINCAGNENLEQFEDYFADVRQNTEIRIASYLAAMQCASYATFARVKDVLRTEETNQVGSFVWTHLTNLQESSSQWKHNLKNLVENEFLRNKFSTDMRKYSRNYEVSTFFDSLNTGVTMESNVVFTSESYLPKSAMLNFTLDLFGEAVNVFEIGARMEGFEQVVENLFGPEGYFPEESIRSALKNSRNKENDPQNKIEVLRNSFTSQTTFKEPAGLLYAKIFGNEISYTHFKDLEGLVGGPVDGRSILDALMKLFRQQDVDYTKSFVFLDSSYKVPTVLGFPLELAVNGTATIGLTVKSKMDLKDLWAHKIAIEGKIYPSAAVEIIGTMTVDSFISKIGLRSVNTLNSNTYLDGHAFINKGKLVDLKINVPKQQMNIINVESQVYVVQSDRVYPMDDITDNVEDWQGCTQKLFSTVTGLQLCYRMRYANASLSPNAPYFPLTGRFKYSMDIKKTDVFDSYQLSLKTHTQIKNYRPIYSMSFYLDTPNSLIDRKIETSYLLDCEKLSLNATLVSPFANLEINSKIGDDFDNLGFLLQTKLNNNEVLLAKMTLKSSKVDNTWKYEPLAELNYKNRQVAALSGNVNYLQGKKYNADLKVDGISNEPVLISGDLHLGPKKFKLTASIKSNDINGNAHAVVIKKPESISIAAKTTYDYHNYKGQVLDFEFKQHTIRIGSVSEEILYFSVNSTQKPSYNTLLSFNVRRDKLYFETKGLATVFGATWETHQLLKFLRSMEHNDMALKCSFTCMQKNIDYNIDLLHIKSENAFKVHGLLQLNKIQRLEALIDYNKIIGKNRTLDLLLYYPEQAWSVNGIFNEQREKEFNVFVQSFYEINDEKKCIIVLSGHYTNATVAHFQNHTITGTIEIPESNGQFDTPWTISSSLQISPDLFLNTAQLRTRNDLYVSHVTWSQNSFSGLLQINDKQLLVINGLQTIEEISMSFGLNIYQHFEMTAKLLMPYQKFQFLLYWDKDRDMNLKISLTVDRYVNKGLYLVDLEYPNQRVAASFILLPEQVTMNVTWGIDSSQRIYLKAGNKVYDIGGIWFAKLETPFIYLENQEFKMSYYILPENAELKIDVSWRDQKINLVMSGIKSVHHLSGYLDVNTTILEISKISIAVSHTHNNTNGLLKIKNDAAFVFNDHQITGQCLWESQGTNISSNFEIVSSSNTIAPIIGMLVVNNNQSTNHLSSFIEWHHKKISVDYKFENSQSYIKIKTPFKGLEVTELDYTLIGEPDKLVLEIRVNVLTQFNYALVSWNNEGHANIIKFEITCPVLGTHKVMFKHSTVFGHLEEYLVVTQGKNDILAVQLYGELVPILLMDITATVKFLGHKVSVAIRNSPNPIISTFKANWDKTYIKSALTIVFEAKEISDLRWDVSSSLLDEDVTCRYLHNKNSYILAATLPKGYKFNNVLTLENSYKSIKNVLNVDTPSRSGSLYYSHILALNNHSFNHQIVFKMNDDESKLALNYNLNNDINFIDAASIKFITPWQHPITLNFSMPRKDQYIWKPSFYLEYNNERLVDIESSIKLQHLSSDIHVSFHLPYTVPFNVDANYDFTQRTKTIDILVNGENEFLKIACDFYLEQLQGSLSLNTMGKISDQEKQFLIAFLSYDVSNPLKTANLKLSLPEQQHKLEFQVSTSEEKGMRKGNMLLVSTIPNWEKLFLDLALGLTQDESYIMVGKNDKNLTGRYKFEKSIKSGLIFYDGRVTLMSHFENIKNCSFTMLYKSTDKFQDITLGLTFGKHNASFNGNYQLTDQTSKGTRIMSLDGGLNIEYYQTTDKNPVSLFNIDSNMKGSIEVKKLGGRINAIFNSNIANLKKVDVDANYELNKKGYKITAATTYNKDYYCLEHYFQPLPNKLEFLASLHTPPKLYGNVVGKLFLVKHDDSIETELFFEKNLQLYNLSVITKYDSFLSSDTVIKIFTPDNEYKAGIKSNVTLTESRVEFYAILNDDVNQAKFSIKTKNYKKAELYLYVDLVTLKISPWTLNAKYDFSSAKRTLSVRLNDDRGAGLEVTLDKQKLHVNVNTPSTKNFLIISGTHKTDDINDFLLSYAVYHNDEKLKIDLTHNVDEGRTISLVVTTTYKGWSRTAFVVELYNDAFKVLTDFKSHVMLVSANKNALFNNQELLLIEFNKAPVVFIWSGNDESYLTSLTSWGNYKFLVLHASDPKMYALNVLQDGRELISIVVENMHTKEFFDFTAKMTNSLFPKFSNISAYFYTDYEIPNEFRFTLNNERETILALSYNFQLEEESYLAVFNFNSQLEALQAFVVSFSLDPQFLLEFEISKTQYHIEKLYKLTVGLPFRSNESQLEVAFPWQDENLSISLLLRPSQVDFYLKSPMKDWNEIILKASSKKVDDSVSGLLQLQKNNAYAAAEWSYGYDKDSAFISVDIKNNFSGENQKMGKIIIDGKYVSGATVLFVCDLDEFGNKLNINYLLNRTGAFLETQMVLPALLIRQLILNITMEPFQKADAILQINEHNILNFSIAQATLSDQVSSGKAYLNIYENLYYYDLNVILNLKNLSNLIVIGSLNSKTYNYLVDVKARGHVDFNILNGNISTTIETGWESETPTSDNYEIAWLVKHRKDEKSARIDLKQNHHLTYINLVHFSANDKLKSEITVACGSRALNLELEGTLNSETAGAVFTLTTPLKELSQLKLETCLTRGNGTFEFHNFLSWPDRQSLTLDLLTYQKTSRKTMELLFTSPFNKPLKAELSYILNSNEIAFNSVCSMGEDKVTLEGTIIPKSYLTTLFTSPFPGYTSLNLTCFLDRSAQTTKVYFEKETLVTEFTGAVKAGENKIYEINMVANNPSVNQNDNFAKMLLKIDTMNMKGKAEIFWQDNDVQVGVNYDPKDLLLEVKSPFELVQEVRLQGEYVNDVNTHGLKASGVWNKISVNFQGSLLVENKNFTILSQITVGDTYQGVLNFYNSKIDNNQREIHFNAYFPDKESNVILKFMSEKGRKSAKSRILLSTPFEVIQGISAESTIQKGYVEAQLKANLTGQMLISNYKSSFKNPSQFDAIFEVAVPQIASKWEVETSINIYQRGVLKINYTIDGDSNNLNLDYKIVDSKLETRYFMNGTKANVSHILELYFKNERSHKEYGFLLNKYKLLFKVTDWFYQIRGLIQANVPYFDVNAGGEFITNVLQNKVSGKCFYNGYDIDINAHWTYSTINASTVLTLGSYNLASMFTEIELLPDGFFVKNNISDAEGISLNTTVLYRNNKQAIKLKSCAKHSLLQAFATDIHISKSLDKIYVDIQDIFNLDVENTQPSSKLHLLFANIDTHSMKIDFKNTSFSLNINSSLVDPHDLQLTLGWSSKNDSKRLNFRYLELNNSVLRGNLHFNCSKHPTNGTEYILTTNAYSYDKIVSDFTGKILITNITQGFASLDILDKKSHAYFLLNPSDPYMAGLTIGSPFLPYGGITLETGTSVNSTSIFVFAGSGPSDLLEKGFIHLESHDKYILFEARREDNIFFVKYEAPALAWLQLANLQAELNVQDNYLQFSEDLEIKSEITDNIAFNSKFSILKSGLETKVYFLLPFISSLKKFNAELLVPFGFSDDFNPKILIEFPKATYSAHAKYKYQNNQFIISGGYQCATGKFDALLHLTNIPLPTIFAEVNLPYGEYNHFALSLKRPKDLSTEQEILCYLEVFNTRFELNYMIIYKRDRQLLKALLTTSLESYDKFSLNMEYQNDQPKILKALVFYPDLQQECGFDFGLNYRNMKEFKLDAKISLPVEINGFAYGEFVFAHNLNFKIKNISQKLSCFSKINNFNASFDLETALNSNFVLFNLDTRIRESRFYTTVKSLGSIFDSIDFLFELGTPISVARNVKLFLVSSVNLNEGVHTGLVYNSKTLLQVDFIITNGEVFLKCNNIWKPLLIEYQYSYTNNFRAAGKVCWDLNYPEISQFGGHLILGKNFSIALILPTRVMSVDANYFIDEHNENYFGRISWYKEKEIAASLSFTNYTLNDTIYLRSTAAVTLPFRTFEVIDEVEGNFQESPSVKSKFTFKWNKNDASRISLQNYVCPGKLESRLFIPILEHEIVLNVDVASLTKIPSYMKAQLEYSNDIEKRIEFEMYYDRAFTDVFRTERQFSLKHPASKIDYSIHFSTTRTPEFTTGNITLQYMNYLLRRPELIKSSLKIGHERFEVAGEIETSKNYLSIAGGTRSGANFQGFLMTVQLNRKDPLIVEGVYNFKPTGSSVSLTSRYGNSRRYDFYAGLPSKREITVKLLHKMYDTETVDALFTLKLNSSQILWLKLNWKNELLPEFKNAILEEYNDVRFIIEATGQQLIEVIDDDFGQALISDASELEKNLSSYTTRQINLITEDYNKFSADVKEGYQSNAFYCKDIQETIKIQFPNLEVMKTILLNPIWDFLEMLYKGAFVTIDDMFLSLRNICSIVQTQIEVYMKEVKDIKKLKARAKEILKNGINEARESLKQIDILVAQLMDSIDEYVTATKEQCEEFFEPYLKLLDDFVIYVEQRLAILQMLVLDMLDTVQHYILNLRESREVLKIYALYLNWLEEFHITDILEPIGDIIEAILETVITDIKKVMDDYRIYIDAVSEAVFGNYQDINNLPPLTEFREMLNKIYQRTLWIWNYHNLSEAVKNCIHKILSDFDDYLASLIKLDNSSNDFENVLGQSDYIFRPDMGIIEITQPLPVEWEAFDEMPYFEQHPLYHKIKKRVENLIQIERHHFNDILNIIKSYTGESSNNLLSPPTNNIGMVVGKSHYITFDKTYYSFAGECSYLLASDFVTNTFSVVINYHLDKSIAKKKSISVITDHNNVEISANFSVALNNVEIDLPLFAGSLTVIRENSEILVENSKGLKVICNLYYDYCTVELSGWLFGKTGGLLGTLDNEKVTDMSLPDGDQTSDVLEFVQSWQVGTSKCNNTNHANDTTKMNISPLSTTLFETLCQVFFINANSPFGHCFNSVDPKPFYEICVNDMKDVVKESMCSSAAAYKAQCEQRNVHVDMPEMCVHCKHGVDLNEDIFDRDNPKSIDVVILKENACFDDNQDFSSFPSQINVALESKGFKDNQFAVVGYGGSIGKPFICTSKKQIWTTAEETAINVRLNFSSDSQKKVSAIDAIEFASYLEFRPGISKLFILMQCDYYTEFDNLNNLHNMFGEKDITLHVLKAKPFNQYGENLLELDNKGHVLYIQHGFNVQDIEAMNTTVNELVPNQITDIYSLLALSTNGTVLSVDNEITHRKDLISASWAEIISQTAKRSPCQRCKCVTNPDGTGKVECTRCMSPIVKQLLNEYESNIMEFHTDQDSEEYV